jgi:hypothetical protein
MRGINDRYFKVLQPGDKVRIDILKLAETSSKIKSAHKSGFLKGDRDNYSKEVYEVIKKGTSNYYTTTYNPEIKFYRGSLLKVQDNAV